MNFKELGKEIQDRQALRTASEFCGQCMRELPVKGLYFLPLSPNLQVDNNIYKCLAIWLCVDCCIEPKQDIIEKSLAYMLNELNIEVLYNWKKI